jgi:hypothetical protein
MQVQTTQHIEDITIVLTEAEAEELFRLVMHIAESQVAYDLADCLGQHFMLDRDVKYVEGVPGSKFECAGMRYIYGK